MAENRQAQAPSDDPIQDRISKEYEWGFVTEIEEDKPAKGLNEDVIRAISARKHEPEWLLEWRLRAYRAWLTMGEEEPTWANIKHPKIDFQDIHYYVKASGSQEKNWDDVPDDIAILAPFVRSILPAHADPSAAVGPASLPTRSRPSPARTTRPRDVRDPSPDPG